MNASKHFPWNAPALLQSALWVVSAALLLGILSHAYIGGFSRYMADDFCTAGKLNQVGFWESQAFWFQQWTGRFSFTFLVTLLGSVGSGITPLLPVIYLLWVAVIGSYFTHFLLSKLRIDLPPVVAVFLALSITFMTLATTPNVSQNLYWLTGSATYLFPFIVSLVLFSLLLRFSDQAQGEPAAIRFSLTALVFIMALLNNGFSEILSLVQSFLLLFVNFYYRFLHPDRKLNWLWLIALAGDAVGLVIMLAAPGNAIRGENFQGAENILILAANTLRFSATYSVVWLVNNVHFIWPTSMVVIAATYLARRHLPIAEAGIPRELTRPGGIMVILAGMIFLLVASFLPPVWVANSAPEDRAKFFATFLLTTISVFASVGIGVQASREITRTDYPRHGLLYVALAFFVYYLAAVPVFHAWHVFSGRTQAAAYADAWDARDAEIDRLVEAGESRITVKPLPDNPYGLEEVNGEPTHWLNVCAAEYYGVEQISVK